MSNQKLTDRLASRSPLGRRETVEPVNMYGPQADKTTKPQVEKETNGQVERATSHQRNDATSGKSQKTTKPQVEKYTTHLRPETIKAVKRAALDRDRKDYEIVQAALDAYLRRERGGSGRGKQGD